MYVSTHTHTLCKERAWRDRDKSPEMRCARARYSYQDTVSVLRTRYIHLRSRVLNSCDHMKCNHGFLLSTDLEVGPFFTRTETKDWQRKNLKIKRSKEGREAGNIPCASVSSVVNAGSLKLYLCAS